jgi:DNA ligase-1
VLAGELVAVSNAIAGTPARLEKIARLSDLLKRLSPPDVAIALPFLTGSLRQGRIGIGYAAIREAAGVPAAGEATLQLADIDDVFERVARVRGGGSASERVRLLRELFARATADEQDFLSRLLFGELRQGAVEGVLADAVARAAAVPPDRVRRAAMLAGALAPVAVAALQDGAAALDRFVIAPFAPVQPMLAGSAEGVEQAIAEFDAAALEFKLDGARVQVHKVGDEVRAYSRSLRDVTAAIPDVVAQVRAMRARELILDGEVLARRPDGTPHPFQVTMRRFGRKEDAAPLRETLPLSPFFFDCLYAEGAPLIDEPLARRVAILHETVPTDLLIPRLVPASPVDAEAFVRAADAAGHEGVMVKALDAPYAAGRRGAAWLKVKRPRTLDLVVLAAEWGSGRRRGTLSNLHLGARDTARGGFVMLGKTFKGLTDETLAWQTRELLAREIGRDGHIVFVRPELVVEIAFNELQESPQYPGRIALRFARVKGYRPDKPASEADTFATIQKLYEGATGLAAPVR